VLLVLVDLKVRSIKDFSLGWGLDEAFSDKLGVAVFFNAIILLLGVDQIASDFHSFVVSDWNESITHGVADLGGLVFELYGRGLRVLAIGKIGADVLVFAKRSLGGEGIVLEGRREFIF